MTRWNGQVRLRQTSQYHIPGGWTLQLGESSLCRTGPRPQETVSPKFIPFSLGPRSRAKSEDGGGAGEAPPRQPPERGAGRPQCLAWHLPESHSEGKGGHGNHWLPFCLRVHTLQVVQFRDTRALKSLLDSLPQFSLCPPCLASPCWRLPLKFPGSQAGLLLVFSSA